MRRGKARTRLLVILGMVLAYVALLLAMPLIIPFDPSRTDLSAALRAPGEGGFALGSDSVGRDVLVRTLCGGSESVLMGFGVLAIVVTAGLVFGGIAGYFGGAVDAVVDKVITAFQAFPSFVLAVAIAGILGQGIGNMVIAIAAVYWTQFARLVRGITVSFKHSACVDAARMCGAKPLAILRKYLLPELAGPTAVMAALSMSDVVLTMAGLSFIGLGPSRPTNEWGAMMAEAQPTFQYALWCMVVPMAALFITVVLFNLLGDALRDAFDARAGAEKTAVFGKLRRVFPGKGPMGASLSAAAAPTREE